MENKEGKHSQGHQPRQREKKSYTTALRTIRKKPKTELGIVLKAKLLRYETLLWITIGHVSQSAAASECCDRSIHQITMIEGIQF